MVWHRSVVIGFHSLQSSGGPIRSSHASMGWLYYHRHFFKSNPRNAGSIQSFQTNAVILGIYIVGNRQYRGKLNIIMSSRRYMLIKLSLAAPSPPSHTHTRLCQ